MLKPLLNTDAELAARIAHGDHEAFGQMYLHYYDKLYSVAMVYLKVHQIAQDIVQQVFLQLWEKRGKFTEVENLENYLFISARNMILNSLRRQTIEEKYQSFVKELFLQEANTPEEELILKQKGHIIERIISTLPEREQQAFRLSRQHGLRYEEIAAEMKLSIPTVKKLMHQALERIRALLIDHKDEFIAIFFSYFMTK